MKVPFQNASKRTRRVIELCLRIHANNPEALDCLIAMLNGTTKDRMKALLLAELESNAKGEFLTPTGEWLPPEKIVIGHVVAKRDGGEFEYFNLAAISEKHNQVMSMTTQFGTAARKVQKEIEDGKKKAAGPSSKGTAQKQKDIGVKKPQGKKAIEFQKHARRRFRETGINYWKRRSQGLCGEGSSPKCKGFVGYEKRPAYCTPCRILIRQRVADHRSKPTTDPDSEV